MKGSHNSLSYARPLKWWGWLIRPIWRCQKRTIEQQIERGITAFDIRIALGDDGNWRGAHGCVLLDVSPQQQLEIIARNCVNPYVRIILERGTPYDCAIFRSFCEKWMREYPNIAFFGGNYKPNWRPLYNFDRASVYGPEATLEQHIGSMSGSWYGKIWPWLWARLNRRNAPFAASHNSLPIVLMDFV